MIYEIEYDRHEIYGDDIYIFYFNNEGQELCLQLNLKDYYENDCQLLETSTYNPYRELPDHDFLTFDEFVFQLQDDFYMDFIKEMLTKKINLPYNYSELKIQ